MAYPINLPRAAWRRQPQIPVMLDPAFDIAVNMAGPTLITKSGASPASAGDVGLETRDYGICLAETIPMGQSFTAVGARLTADLLPLSSVGSILLYTDIPYKNADRNAYSVFSVFGDSGGSRLTVSVSQEIGYFRILFWAITSYNPVFQLTYDSATPIRKGLFLFRFSDANAEIVHNGVVLASQSTTGVAFPNLYQADSILGNCSSYAYSVPAAYLAYSKQYLPRSYGVENPWQLFSPAPSRFILIPSAGATTHDVALLLAANTAFAPVGNANFNAGLTLSTLAGALSGKNAQYNTNLTLQTNVSMTLAKAMQVLAEIQVGMTLDQQLSATNAAVAAITESIACSHTSTVTANLLAGLSFAISQTLTSTTGGTVAAALSLALQSALSPSVTAGWATNALLAATLQSTLTSTLATSAALTLPATLTITVDGERLTSGDVGLVLSMQAGLTTSATAILGAHVALATQLLATPAAAGSFATALSLANSLSTQFDVGNTISSALSLAMSLSLAEAAAVSLGGQLTLGTVLSEAQSVVAALTANASFPVSLAVPLSGSVAMEAGVSLDWTLSFSSEGAFFAITVGLPTGRIVKILASEHLVNITASERLITIPPSDPFVSVN